MLFKPFDIGIVFSALGAVIASFFLAYSGSSGSVTVHVRGENGVWVFPIDAAESLAVSGPLGDTKIEIGGGGASITASPCANQTCVSAGSVRAPGQWAACLPNRVMLYVDADKSGPDNGIDAAAW